MRWELPAVGLHDVLACGEVELAPIILEDAGVPPYVGSPHHDDLRPVLTIARSLAPRKAIEMGTSYGNLAANICRQCPSATVYTVNALPDQQTGGITTHSLTGDQIGRVYLAYGYSSRVVQILSNTLDLDLSQVLTEGTVDLAIIDACHDPEYVVNDFHKVRPFMSSKGIVLFHDTHPSMKGHLRGSYMACMLLRRAGYDIRHIENTWWGVWRAAAQPVQVEHSRETVLGRG